MNAKPRTLRQEQAQLAARLRAEGRTWVEVAEAFAERYAVNMRVALRLVRGWSQREAADEWNERWPAKIKTFKNFSYWELWPAATGHAPSLDVLISLAELYECSPAALLADAPAFDYRDSAHRARQQLASIPTFFALRSGAEPGTNGLSANATRAPTTGASDSSSESMTSLMQQLEEMDVEELARTVASWAGQAHVAISRRSLLLKLSAALALAAADPSLVDNGQPALRQHTARTHNDLSGIWHSRYVFYSTGRAQEFEGQHYVVLRPRGSQLVGQSLPHTLDSRLKMELSVDASIATGTWTERTSPTGYYRGAAYHGTLQLVVNPMGRVMSGKWLGFGKNFKVNSGEWELSWVDDATSRVMREYHLRA